LKIIYQRRTKKGVGWLLKTVLQRETVKTQRVEVVITASAIDREVRFFFIFLKSLLVKYNCEAQNN
jgi:diacylglycerol kinase family enzyme